jgi:hypothetical protein
MLASLALLFKMLGRKRRAGQEGAPLPAGTAPRWLVARSARYRQQFPLRDWYDCPVQRGSAWSLANVGASYREATPEQRAMRRRIQMTGRGLYRGRGGFFGRALGNMFGMGDLGDKLGDAAWNVGRSFLPKPVQDIGSAVFGVTDKLSGKGLYRGRGVYAANNLIFDDGAKASSVVPQFNPTDMHTITFSNREYVRDIFAPGASNVFHIESWELNPGLPTSFPWLSQLAVNFEEYELVQLVYTFKSTISDFAANSGQVGQVIMCTQYNPDSSPFATKDEMMLYEGGMSCKTTESMLHGIECDPKKIAGSSTKYVRVGSVPPTEDLKNYDLGRTSLAVVNAPTTYANQQIGELWVSYTIMLRKPKIASGNAYNIRRDEFIAPPHTVLASGIIAQPASFLAGSRNSFGCEVYIPTTAEGTPVGASTDNLISSVPAVNNIGNQLQFMLTVPSSYSGILRIRLVQQSTTITTAVVLHAVSLAPATIFRFQDIPGILPDTTPGSVREWSHVLNTALDSEGGSATARQSDLELHLRVQPPSNGIPNRIAFTTAANLVAGTFAWNLEINQINSFLSVQDNGKNDRVDLVQHFSGQPALYI